jgi:hypothetical protein
MMSEVNEITVNYSEDGLWGSTGPDGYNQSASEKAFENMLTGALKANYSGANVRVVNGNVDNVTITTADGDEETGDDLDIVNKIIENVYGSFGWLVS